MHKKRILVVDDVPLYRLPIAMALESEGYRTVCAADGREATHIVDANLQPFDLMIVDCVMPDVDGLAFLKATRGHPAYDDVPAIMLTEVADRDVVVQAFALGARDYVLKSCFSMPELLEKVAQQLNPPAPETSQNGHDDHAPPSEADTSPGAVLYAVRKFIQRNPIANSVQRVLALTATEDGDGAALAYAVNAEPLLAARVLKLANSSAYSRLCRRVTDLDEAVAMVGFAAIRNIAVGAYFCAMGASGRSAMDARVKRSIHVYAVARIMERLLSRRELSALGHLAGLCHELPETVLELTFPQLYRRTLDQMRERNELFAVALRRGCGLLYQQLAAEVYEGLALSREITEALLHCAGHGTAASETTRTLTHALQVAHVFAQGHGYVSPSEVVSHPSDRANMEQLIARNSFAFSFDAAFEEDVSFAGRLFAGA